MPGNDLQQEKKASSTAFFVLDGFVRGIQGRYQGAFTVDEVTFANQMRRTILSKYQDTKQWATLGIFSLFPNAIHRPLINSQVKTDYYRHMVGRKLAIKNKIQNAIEAGVEQVIFLGAGYDIRPYVAAENTPNVNFYEIDTGETRRIKDEALNELKSGDIPENLFLVDHNFADGDAFSTLKNHRFDKNKKTLVIAEGLTPYLKENEVKALLSSIKDNLRDDTEVLISFTKQPVQHSKLDGAVRGQAGEEYQSNLPQEEIIPFVNENGYSVEQKLMHNDLHEKMSNGTETVNDPIQENYVLITPSDSDDKQENDLDNIPNMLELEALRVENIHQESSWCRIV